MPCVITRAPDHQAVRAYINRLAGLVKYRQGVVNVGHSGWASQPATLTVTGAFCGGLLCVGAQRVLWLDGKHLADRRRVSRRKFGPCPAPTSIDLPGQPRASSRGPMLQPADKAITATASPATTPSASESTAR